MKKNFKFLVVVLVASLLASCQRDVYMFTSFHEPADEGLRYLYSEDGYSWTTIDGIFLKPELGEQKIMRDPSMVRDKNGVYHLVWTIGWQGNEGIGYASSKDLIHWENKKIVPVMEHEATTVNIWAPELFYDEDEDRFIIIWASTIPERFPKGEEEERNNHRMYYTTTQDFETFTETKLFADPGFSIIDAVIVKKDKDDYVLVLKDNTRPNRNLKVAFADNPLGPYENVSEPYTDFKTEGPSVIKVNDEWLIYFDSYGSKSYEAVSTKDFKTFKKINDKISIPEGHKHGTIFKASKKDLKRLLSSHATAQDTMTYVGKTLSNVDYHHGQLKPAVGTHNIQTFRANRAFPERAGGLNFTYNHQPFLAYWNDTYYLQFLSNPVGEHVAEGKTSLQTSKDGYTWSDPIELFPPYLVPEGFSKPGRTDKAGKDLYAIMHQRMGFYTAKNGKLLTIGYYGVALDAKDDPNDGNGIGRVVREIKRDGSFGPIYFIRFNASFDQKLAKFPFYTKSEDKAFVAACNELMEQPLMMQQWVEEADRNDPLIPFQRPLKAFAYYTLDNGDVVGMWKHALTSVSKDKGKTWAYDPLRAPGFVNSNAKIWGQRTADNRFATVYNPSEFRWPLAVSTSDDGLTYTDLLLINGDITTMRYGGNYKSYGPQYPRGIQEGNGVPPDNNMWVTYSMNKEDMWVAKVPVPVTSVVAGNVHDDFTQNGTDIVNQWNIYSPLWASVKVEDNALVLRDKDKFDYAKAERVIDASEKVKIAFTVTPKQADHGNLQIELVNDLGQAAARIVFDADGQIKNKAGYRMSALQSYEAGKTYAIVLTVDVHTRSYQISINGTEKGTRLFFQPISEISRVSFRTGDVRRYPDADTPTDQDFDVEDADGVDREAAYAISLFQAEKLN